jgi:hypothetical protein
MSKLMEHLNNLNTLRKKERGMVVHETSEPQGQLHVLRERKGVYFIGFLVIVLIAFSALSMSASLKTSAQLEKTEAASAGILQMLRDQKNETEALKGDVTRNHAETLAKSGELQAQLSKQMSRVSEIQGQVERLENVIHKSENDILDLTSAFKVFRNSIQDSIDDLKGADRTMLEKYSSLDRKIQQLNDRRYLPGPSSEGETEIINHP